MTSGPTMPVTTLRRARWHADLLVRALRARDDWHRHLDVRSGPGPASWWPTAADDVDEVDVGTLDAIVLLLTRRGPVLVTDDHAPWAAPLAPLRDTA